MSADRLQTGLLVSWLAASTLVFPVLLLPVLLQERTLFMLMPVCTHSGGNGGECAFCGTIAGMLLVSHGKLNAALNRSAVSIPLYSALVWNECVAIWYALGQLVRALTPRRSRVPVQTEGLSCRS